MKQTPIESTFLTHDGQALFYRHWRTTSAQRKGVIVLFHRGHEHSERVAHLVEELKLEAYDFFAWDARGHGRSPGARGYSPSLADSIRDVQTFIEHIQRTEGVEQTDIAVIAQSVGAVLVSAWMHDYAPKIRCAILASPAFKVKLYVPFARLGLSLLQKLRGQFYVNSYVKAKFLTHDPQRITSYDQDPLIARAIASHILLDLYSVSERIVQDSQAIVTPVQLLISGSDWVVHHQPQEQFFNRLGSVHKEKHVLEGFYHDTLGELNRGIALEHIRRFVNEHFERAEVYPDLTQSHLQGWSFDEAHTLNKALPAFSLKGLYWSSVRWSLKLGGMLSNGVRLGHDTGFDSGSTLDYVYCNKPQGMGFIGRLIDQNYLNSIGWRGIRQRKIHIEALLTQSMTDLRANGKAIHILDIAAGHGRYLLETIAKMEHKPDSVTLRDYSEINVRSGQALIQSLGLEHIAKFVLADAFNEDSIAQTSPTPTIVVVSGLYELFSDNAIVARSLKGVSRAIHAGGHIIYTGQPWHPQLELIARALTSHRAGQAWVMRRRSQAEMDQMVQAAGFVKIDQRIDGFGIFTVSVAQRT